MNNCSLDAEGAFDTIPDSIIYHKASAVLPKRCWHVMHSWFNLIILLNNPMTHSIKSFSCIKNMCKQYSSALDNN